MKKIVLTLALALIAATAVDAQKFALVDMDYILKAIPAYETANEQLDQLSKKWQKEVENMLAEVQTMYKNYQTELVFLTDDMKVKREEEIVAKEKEANELKRKYFGVEGELYKKRQSLIKPIQDEVYNAVKKVSEERGYSVIFDRASSSNIIFASPRIDVSNDVLTKMGYGK